jgi:alanyl-tRNA synthetase
MTERCYYQDAYTTSFTAAVTERLRHNGHLALVLDKTYFYPTSGGQPADRGSINGMPVVDVFVREDDGCIVHVLDGEVWTSDVHGTVDWERRFDHMQQHTGQHILSQAFIKVAGAQTVGFHLSDNSLTIDLDRASLKPDEVEAAETMANQIVWEDRPLRIRMVSHQEAGEMQLRKLPAVDGELVRLVEIDGFDRTACGGTHVARTGAVGLIKIVKLETGGDHLRIEFACGQRALVDYRRKNRIVTRLANEFTTGYREIEHSVDKLREELKQAQREVRKQRQDAIQLLAKQLAAESDQKRGTRIVAVAFEDRTVEDLRILASHLAEQPGMVALLGLSGEKVRLIFARHERAPGAMDELLKSALQTLGSGAGGGTKVYAQGGGPPATHERVQ